MTTLTLPASVHPDVLIADGHTYVALPLPTGLTIYDIAYGQRDAAFDYEGNSVLFSYFPIGDWPRLFAHSSGVLCAYKLSEDNTLAVANITTGELTRTGIALIGNSPICWRDDDVLCVQVLPPDSPIVVYAGTWPVFPHPPAIRQGVGTGLAQWMAANLWTWDEVNSKFIGYQSQAVIIPAGAYDYASVGQAPQGGILVQLGPNKGYLQPFAGTYDPRPALAANGSLSVVYWVAGPHGSEATVLLQGVTPADLIVDPIRPVSDVVPLPSVSVAGSYVFKNPNRDDYYLGYKPR